MIQKYLKGSVFVRIIIIFLGMMIPLYLLGVALYSLSTATLRNEFASNMSTQMDFYLNSLENEVTRIESLQYEFMSDEDLNYLANAYSIMWNYEKTIAERRVEQRLVLFRYSSKYIQNIYVHIPGMGKTISSENGMVDLSKNYPTILYMVSQENQNTVQVKNDGWYLYSAFPPRTSNQGQPLYIIETVLSRKTIDDTFSNVASKFGGSFAYDRIADSQFGTQNKALNQDIINAFANSTASSMFIHTLDQGTFLVIRKHSDYLRIDYFAYISEDQVYAPAKQIAELFVLFSIASISMVVVFFILSRRVVHRPIATMVSAFKSLESGDLDISIKPETEDEFHYLYIAFNKMVQSLKNLFNKVTNYELLTHEAQLKQLQAQISPHFLYNSLYIIYRMAQMGDLENLIPFTGHLNSYYRYITRDAREEVTLAEEIEHAKNYTAIQQTRFSNRIRITWEELPETYKNLIVPRLILQPLIENAFQHGLRNVERDGWLEIRLEDIPYGLQISVECNGECPSSEDLEDLKRHIFSEEHKGEVTALRNIHQRLTMRFSLGSGLFPSITSGGNFCISLVIKGGTYA